MRAAKWNPRFAAYAAAHDRTPHAQLAHDREAFPGGRMAGFMLWISARWTEWRKAGGSERDHVAFDAWLATRVESPLFGATA